MEEHHYAILRQVFARAAVVEPDESFVAAARQGRIRRARRAALLRALFGGCLLLSLMMAASLLLPWLSRLLLVVESLAAATLHGSWSVASLFWLASVGGAVAVGAWGWRWVMQGN